MITLTEQERDQLTQFFSEGAARVKVEDPYWIDGADSGEDYCLECAMVELEKELARYKRLPKAAKERSGKPSICGGYRSENDSPPCCYSCHADLDGSLTKHGCRQELDHFTEYGFDIASDEDRYAMSEVINARGWMEWESATYQHEYERKEAEDYFSALNALGQTILADLREKTK